jgi:hypothetical protein
MQYDRKILLYSQRPIHDRVNRIPENPLGFSGWTKVWTYGHTGAYLNSIIRL